MTYTEKELEQFLHGISLSLLSKKSAQHWRYDEETAKEIEWLEALERKVRADKADRKTEPNSSEKPNNCEWSVEYAKEMLDTMSCEECGHWEHGAGDHYYCALLEMRQECYFESKNESTLMFANEPKTEPEVRSNLEPFRVDEPQTERSSE